MGLITKRNIVLGIIGLIVLSAIAQTMTPKTQSNTNSTASSNVQTPQAQSEDSNLLKIGDTISLKDFKYKVLDVSKTKTVGNQFAGKTADGIYIILEVEAENMKKDSEILTYGNFKVKDSKNREFDVDTLATIYTDNGIFVNKLQPGISKRGKLVFEVPNDESLDFRIRIREGLILKKQDEVKLGNLTEINTVTQITESSSLSSNPLPQDLCQEFKTQCDNEGDCEDFNNLKQFGAC